MPKGTTGSSSSSSHIVTTPSLSTSTHIHGGVTIGSPVSTWTDGWVLSDDYNKSIEARLTRVEGLLNLASKPSDEDLEIDSIRNAWGAYTEKEAELFSVAFAELSEAKEELEVIIKLAKEGNG